MLRSLARSRSLVPSTHQQPVPVPPRSPPPARPLTRASANVGKYYFASKKALREAWNDADFYNRSGAPYGDDDAGENKVVRPTYNGDPSVLTNYMNILTEEPYVAPKPPDPREHGPRVSLLIAKIRRETERDADWNLLKHPPKGYFDHEKVECCGKHADKRERFAEDRVREGAARARYDVNVELEEAAVDGFISAADLHAIAARFLEHHALTLEALEGAGTKAVSDANASADRVTWDYSLFKSTLVELVRSKLRRAEAE